MLWKAGTWGWKSWKRVWLPRKCGRQPMYRAYWDILHGGAASINAGDLGAFESRLGDTYTEFSATI